MTAESSIVTFQRKAEESSFYSGWSDSNFGTIVITVIIPNIFYILAGILIRHSILQYKVKCKMNEIESDCESVDSGLETGNSNLETSDNGFLEEEEADCASDGFDKPAVEGSYDLQNSEDSESIYENAALLKSTNFIKPISSTLEKYEFGQNEDARSDSLGDESHESVMFQDIEDFDKPASDIESKTISWGVRIGNFPQSPSPRNNNPTEDKIAKEIRELKEREDELIRLREAKSQELNSPTPPSPTPSPEVPVIISQITPKSSTTKSPGISEKFNPALYRPVIIPPRPRIMQDFIANGGKVTAFTQPDNTVIQLRKPQVHKSVPKVSPPVGTVRQSTGSVLDKIQAELAETKKREDELRKARRDMFRSQPDLSKMLDKEKSSESDQIEDLDQLADSDCEETPSLMHTRGKSSLISVWESRIQFEKAA